jgi:hypothetical protein
MKSGGQELKHGGSLKPAFKVGHKTDAFKKKIYAPKVPRLSQKRKNPIKTVILETAKRRILVATAICGVFITVNDIFALTCGAKYTTYSIKLWKTQIFLRWI